MKDKKSGHWRLILLAQYIIGQHEAFTTLRLRFMGLLQVQIVQYLRMVSKNKSIFWQFSWNTQSKYHV